MICPHCGAQLSDGSTFCTNCGTRLDTAANTQPQKRFCTSCGAEIPAGSSFCVQCGAPVAGQPGTQGQGNPVYRATQASAAPAGQTAVRPPLSVPYGASQSAPQMAQVAGGASQDENRHSSKRTTAIVVVCIAVAAVVGVGAYFFLSQRTAASQAQQNDQTTAPSTEADSSEKTGESTTGQTTSNTTTADKSEETTSSETSTKPKTDITYDESTGSVTSATYGLSVTLPSGMTSQTYSDGTGITLKDSGSGMVINVWAKANDSGQSLDYVKQVAENGHDVDYDATGDGWFVVSYWNGDTGYYVREYVNDSRILALEFTWPRDSSARGSQIVEDATPTLNVAE